MFLPLAHTSITVTINTLRAKSFLCLLLNWLNPSEIIKSHWNCIWMVICLVMSNEMSESQLLFPFCILVILYRLVKYIRCRFMCNCRFFFNCYSYWCCCGCYSSLSSLPPSSYIYNFIDTFMTISSLPFSAAAQS